MLLTHRIEESILHFCPQKKNISTLPTLSLLQNIPRKSYPRINDSVFNTPLESNFFQEYFWNSPKPLAEGVLGGRKVQRLNHNAKAKEQVEKWNKYWYAEFWNHLYPFFIVSLHFYFFFIHYFTFSTSSQNFNYFWNAWWLVRIFQIFWVFYLLEGAVSNFWKYISWLSLVELTLFLLNT